MGSVSTLAGLLYAVRPVGSIGRFDVPTGVMFLPECCIMLDWPAARFAYRYEVTGLAGMKMTDWHTRRYGIPAHSRIAPSLIGVECLFGCIDWIGNLAWPDARWWYALLGLPIMQQYAGMVCYGLPD
ncbi:hypothetical protein Nepgr_003887 [Nepenthes gracilis]|uniref:Uncharacterized protein n=1 Tax=Nepenthes gracilis TaxID=150966 RepID=A0AAD3S0C7_NEPGR|nr:hypothetical protein Nepgr_003887 [Nepenthes gracilis]